MKKLTFIFMMIAALTIAGCGNTQSAVSSSETSNVTSDADTSASVDSSEQSEESLPDESTDNTGGEDWCFAHNVIYHTFDQEMIDYVGNDAFNEWTKLCATGEPCTTNLVSFIQYFDFPKEKMLEIQAAQLASHSDEYWDAIGMTEEEYVGTWMLSVEQIDAIYSGDEAKIETAFAGYLAADAEDGSRYSLTWLESHTPEEYTEAGIEPQSVDEMLNEIETNDEYQKYRADVQKISDTLEEAEAAVAEMK